MIRKAVTGDRYLLCFDGLTSVVPDDALRDELASASDPQQVVGRLIDRANSLGGPDNTTVILIDVDAEPHGIESPPGMVGAAALDPGPSESGARIEAVRGFGYRYRDRPPS